MPWHVLFLLPHPRTLSLSLSLCSCPILQFLLLLISHSFCSFLTLPFAVSLSIYDPSISFSRFTDRFTCPPHPYCSSAVLYFHFHPAYFTPANALNQLFCLASHWTTTNEQTKYQNQLKWVILDFRRKLKTQMTC